MVNDPLLMELYQASDSPENRALAAKYAPNLLFDEREPFLPLAAGYTLHRQDGPSPSFPRAIQLAPPGKEAAALAVEYTVWWDWDIHHLSEMEHLWIYLDGMGRPLRIEGSLHGGYHELPLLLEGNHPVVLSAPGKHGFASVSSWFRRRAKEFRRSPTRFPGLQAGVLVAPLFAGAIRKRIFDDSLVRSYLVRHAFDPAWKFAKRFSFQPAQLVPWPALAAWIPRRIQAWLEHLESTITPDDYCPLSLFSFDGTLNGLQVAARAGADAVFLPLHVYNDRLEAARASGPALDSKTAYAFCSSEPMRVFIQPACLETIDRLTEMVSPRRLRQLTTLTSPKPAWLSYYRQRVPDGRMALQLTDPAQDPVQAAHQCGAQYVQLRWEHLEQPVRHLDPSWIERIHQAGLGLVSWPADTPGEVEQLSRLGFDIVWRSALQPAAD